MSEPELPPQPGVPPEPTPEQIAEMKRRARSPGSFYSGQQVTDRLRALDEEWKRTGGFDAEYMKQFLARLTEEDPPRYIVKRLS